MIVVIADDLSGAAELAGIAWRHGLTAEFHLEFEPSSTADVVAVDSDSRSLNPIMGAREVRPVAQSIAAARPEWIYKKTDSVLRGNVAAEAGAIREAFGFPETLLVPANPSKHRVIRKGTYYIEDIPLDRTIFAEDPEYPATTSVVRELLKRPDSPHSGPIRIPDVESMADLEKMAAEFDFQALPAGAADFFEALLRRKTGRSTKEGQAAGPTLSSRIETGARVFVCGSQAAWPDRRKSFEEWGWPVCETFGPGFPGDLDLKRPMLLGIGQDTVRKLGPKMLVDFFGKKAAEWISGSGPEIGCVFVEGGATAVAVLKHFGAKQFRVIGEAGPGAPYLQAIGADLPIFCPKPGSYPWPEIVFEPQR